MPEAPPEVDSLAQALRAAAARLRAVGIEGARTDAVALAGYALGVASGEVERLAILGAPAPSGWDALVARRAQRVPLQHLTGRAAFRHLELAVGPGVFVPRPETEVLVDLAVRALDEIATGGLVPRFVDLCTGSGAIALSVAHERPATQVCAVELSEPAHAFARANADDLDLAIDLRLGDATAAFEDLIGSVDVCATNPPYIPDAAVPIDPEVRDHDPAVALYGGPDGLDLPMRLIDRAARLLRPGGVLLVEHGERQGEELVARLTACDGGATWCEVVDHADLTGRPRVLRAVRG